MYLPRIVDEELKELLVISGAVLVEGPKWCGKTSTSKNVAMSEFYVADPSGGFQNRNIAQIDPSLPLRGKTPRMIDEWQEVPELWDAVRFEVDSRNEKGQFILTGSSVPPEDRTVHSGAGRISRLKMRTMTLAEMDISTKEVSLQSLFNQENIFGQNPLNLEEIIDIVCKGGWPGALDLDIKQSLRVSREYLKTIAEEDMSRYDGVERDSVKVTRLLQALARNEETLVSNKTLLADAVDLSSPSLTSYLNTLEKMFVLENIPAWSPNVRSKIRLRSSAKRRFVDPSLAVAALGLTPDKLLNDLNTFGFFFESFVARDLLTYAESLGGKVFHYRESKTGKESENSPEKEADLIVEMPDGRWGAFEVQLGANQNDAAAESLLDISKKLIKLGSPAPSCLVVISGTTTIAHKRPDGVYIIPIACLTNK
jgi:predicted AAA+ superfamily ATPase